MIHWTLGGSHEFTVRLTPDTPWTIRSAPTRFEHIAITPVPIDDVSIGAAAIRSQARFYGRIERVRNRLEFSGSGPIVWLGDGDRPPKGFIPPPVVLPTKTFTQFVNAAFAGEPLNGIIRGAAYGATATTLSADSISNTETIRQAFDRLCSKTGNEWRVNPDLTLDWGAPTSLYKFGGNTDLFLARGMDAEEADTINVLPVTSFDVTEDWSDSIDSSIVVYTGGGGGYVGSYVVRNCGPTGASATIGKTEALTGASAADAGARQAQIAQRYVDRRMVRVSVDVFDIGQYLTKGQPGDFVYLYDLDTGLVDGTVAVTVRGTQTNPISDQRIVEVEQPIRRGMGVYHIATNDDPFHLTSSNTVTDWTPYVDFETGDVQLTCAALAPPSLTAAVNGSTY